MDEVVNVSRRRRRVLCPTCRQLLVEPPGSPPIYQCPFCSSYLLAKGVPPDFQGEIWQTPMNEDIQGTEYGQQTNEQEGMSTDGSELIGSENQLNDLALNNHESIDGNTWQQGQVSTENGSVVKIKSDQKMQLEDNRGNTSTLVGDYDLSADYANKSSTTSNEEAKAVDCENREGAPVSNSSAPTATDLLLDHTITQLPLKDAESCCMLSSSGENKKFVGEGECDTVGKGVVELNIQSEISRDNETELSFKYISSASKSNDQLAPRKRTSRLSRLSSEGPGRSCEMPSELLMAQLAERRALLGEKNSDDYESYSSASESASDESLDSEFDFPSPSVQSLQPPSLSDSLFHSKMPLSDLPSKMLNSHHLQWQNDDYENAEIGLPNPNATLPPSPHQLEWQDADKNSEGILLQNSKAEVTSSSGVHVSSSGEVDVRTAYDVLTAVDRGDKVERSEKHLLEAHHQKDAADQRDQKAGLEDTAVVQGETTGLTGGPANVGGSFDSHDSAETEEGSNGFEGRVAHQLNKHRANLNNDLHGVYGSLGLLLSGAEYPSKLNSGATLKEGTTSARILTSGAEVPLCSLSDGSKLTNDSDLADSLATHENIKLVHSEANVKIEDSGATIATKTGVLTDKASQSRITSHMTCEKIQDGSSDPLYPQQNMLLSGVSNESWGASASGKVPTKRDVKSAYVAHNLGVQPVSLVTEQGYSSSHSAESQSYYERDHLSGGVYGVDRAAAVNMFDSGPHHGRLYSEGVQSEGFQKYTPQVQKKWHSEGPYRARSKKILEGSSRMQQRHLDAAFELADGQGPWQHQKQNRQVDMHTMHHSMNYSGPSNGFSFGNWQPFGSNYHANGSDFFATGVPNSSLALTYEAPPHPWMLPMMPGIHYGCNSAPGYMACMHCQHSHLPQLPMSPCGLHFNQPSPLAYQRGYVGCCNPHQAHQIGGSDLRATGVCSSPPCYPPQTVHINDAAIARRKPRASSARKPPKHYPPSFQRNTAPYIICKRCDEVLEVPTIFSYSDSTAQKIRCGNCNKVAKFSVLDGSWETINAAQESATTNKLSVSASHIPEYKEKSREPPVTNIAESLASSCLQGFINSGQHSPVKQGSFDSQQQISAASKRRASVSFDDVVQSPKCERDAFDQDDFFFRSLSRYSEVDSSRILFNGFKSSSLALDASNLDGLPGGDDMHSQMHVDEKEEGLDFGAPRMSDGESLGQRSPESRMRSPEKKQHFQLKDTTRHTNASLKDVEDAAFALKKKMIAEGKRPSMSLLALLNQDSSKFDIKMVQRVSFDDSRTDWVSTASNTTMDDDFSSEMYATGCGGPSQSSKTARHQHCRRKGSMSVVSMLRRRLKDFSKKK